MRWYSHETQIRWACLQLIRGREISHRCEIAEVNGWRLSAIIYNLRHRYNWPIITRYDQNRIGHYKLGDGVDKDSLAKPRSFYKKKKGAVTPSLKSDSNNPKPDDTHK
jgi:hypothetical protein